MGKKHVENFFYKNNYQANFIQVKDSSTVLKAANEIGVSTNEIAKTLAFIVRNQPVVLVMSGNSKVDNKKFKTIFKTKAKMIPPNNVEQLTNHPIGGVSPFGLKKGISIYLDNSLKKLNFVYPAAGEPNLVLKISVKDLEHLTKGSWIDGTK